MKLKKIYSHISYYYNSKSFYFFYLMYTYSCDIKINCTNHIRNRKCKKKKKKKILKKKYVKKNQNYNINMKNRYLQAQ